MTRRMRIDDLTDLAVPSQPALSPDGSRVVYVLRTLDGEGDRNVDELWSVATAGGTPAPADQPAAADTAPAWSPDGSRLAFLREARCTCSRPTAASPRRSPTSRSARGRRCGARTATASPSPPLSTRPDGTGPLVTTGRRLPGRRCRHVRRDPQPAARGRPRAPATAASSPTVTTPASPPGRRTAAPSPSPARSAPTATSPSAPPCTCSTSTTPRPSRGWSPSRTASPAPSRSAPTAQSLLVVGHPALRLGHAHLLRVPLDGGEPVDVTGHLDRNVMPGGPAYPGARPVETADGRLLFAIRDRGCSHLWDEDGPVLAGAGRVVSGLSVAGGTAVVALATPTSYGEIVALDLATGAETVLTDHGRADVELFVREERTFTISDGTEVQAWLVRDPERQGPLPLLLDVHGGPHNAWNAAADEMHFYHQELAAKGWAVLLVNPRGSDGYGEAFYDGVQGAWGVADHLDFLEPIDALVAEGLADPDRLAVTGYSYGGFMTGWLTAHDDRFKAAVAGGIVSDLVSEYGASDDGALMGRYELGGPPWERPEEYAAMSPITRVDQVTHPDPGAARQGRPAPARSARPSSGTPRCATAASRPSWCSTRAHRTCSSCSARPRSGWTTAAGWSTGSSGTPSRAAGRASTSPTGSAASRSWPPSTASRARSSASSGIDERRDDELVDASYGVLNVRHRRAGRRPTRCSRSARSPRCGRRPWSMQLVDEGLARAGRPGRRGAARAAPRRPRRHQAGHAAPPAHPHQRHRRRRLHRHRPRRRLPREVRRAARRGRRRTTRSARPGPTATPASRCSAG